MSTDNKSFAALEVGEDLGSVVHDVTPELVRDYAESTGDTHGWHTGGDSPFGEAVAHPALATIFSTRLLVHSGYEHSSGGIHAKQEYEFLAPMRIGARVTTRGTVTEKYIRNGRNYIVYETCSVDELGVDLARCVVTIIVPD